MEYSDGDGIKRLPAVSNWIEHYNPEVVIITEFRNNKADELLEAQLQTGGWSYRLCPSRERSHKNTVLIASRYGFDEARQPNLPCDDVARSVRVQFESFASL
jgi:hypothetical protein